MAVKKGRAKRRLLSSHLCETKVHREVEEEETVETFRDILFTKTPAREEGAFSLETSITASFVDLLSIILIIINILCIH